MKEVNDARGLENDSPTSPKPEVKVASKTQSPAVADLTIKSVISHGDGWVAVEMSDGVKYKRWSGTMAWRHNNPGNLRYGDFAKAHGAVGSGQNGMAVFPDPETGRKAQKELLFNPASRYYKLPLNKAIAIYAPAYDNNDPDEYAHFVAQQARISFMKHLCDMTDAQKDAVIAAMGKMEGWQLGQVGKIAK